MKIFINLFLISILTIVANAQSISKEELLSLSIKQLKSIPNYTCDVELKVDVEFIKIGERKGKLSYIKPDSLKYDIEGFALLPKEDPLTKIKNLNIKNYTIIELESESISNELCRNIKIVPNNTDDDIILGQVWIDKKNNIRQLSIFTKEQGKFDFLIDYMNYKYPVPQKITVMFDIKDMKIPPGMTGELNKFYNKEKKQKTTSGKILLNYSNYSFK